MSKNDGGPAFPGESGQEMGRNQQWREPWYPGMSLRDYFAAAALTGLLASGIAVERNHTSDDVAEIAYKNADAMLAERSKE